MTRNLQKGTFTCGPILASRWDVKFYNNKRNVKKKIPKGHENNNYASNKSKVLFALQFAFEMLSTASRANGLKLIKVN